MLVRYGELRIEKLLPMAMGHHWGENIHFLRMIKRGLQHQLSSSCNCHFSSMASPLVFCSSTVNPKSLLGHSKNLSLITKNNSSHSIIFNSGSSIWAKNSFLHCPCISRTRTCLSLSDYQDLNEEEEEEEELVQDLRVPSHWLIPSNALQESEWLKVALHKWLDDEYCVEDTNVEISEVAAKSFYESLVVEKEADLGLILLKMAKDLESISYQESFHGAFTSANAAIQLISQRMDHQ